MSVSYKVIKRTLLSGEEKGSQKYYATKREQGEITAEDLTKEIEKTSTLSGTDIMAVIYALADSMPAHLANGKTIRLGQMGTFRIKISSNGEDTEQEVDERSIRRSKISFTAGKKFTDMIKTLSFNKERP